MCCSLAHGKKQKRWRGNSFDINLINSHLTKTPCLFTSTWTDSDQSCSYCCSLLVQFRTIYGLFATCCFSFPTLGFELTPSQQEAAVEIPTRPKGKLPPSEPLLGELEPIVREWRLRPIGCATWRQSAVSSVPEFLFAFICLRTWISPMKKNGSKSRVDIFQKEIKAILIEV